MEMYDLTETKVIEEATIDTKVSILHRPKLLSGRILNLSKA